MKNQIVIPTLETFFYHKINRPINEMDILQYLIVIYSHSTITDKVYNEMNDPNLHRDEDF